MRLVNESFGDDHLRVSCGGIRLRRTGYGLRIFLLILRPGRISLGLVIISARLFADDRYCAQAAEILRRWTAVAL